MLLRLTDCLGVFGQATPPVDAPRWSDASRWTTASTLACDDFTAADKAEAARAINDALIGGWSGFEIAGRFPLDEIATAHERLEAPRQRGRVVLLLS